MIGGLVGRGRLRRTFPGDIMPLPFTNNNEASRVAFAEDASAARPHVAFAPGAAWCGPVVPGAR